MNQNNFQQIEHNIPCLSYSRPMIINDSLSTFSSFNNMQDKIQEEEINRVNTFISFADSRIQYLDSLKNIGDNWISGNSKQPTTKSIELSKDILKNIKYWYQQAGYLKMIYPKIVMGPTPVGGVLLEVQVYPNITQYIDILDNAINYEIEKDGFYTEEKTDENNLKDALLTIFNAEN